MGISRSHRLSGPLRARNAAETGTDCRRSDQSHRSNDSAAFEQECRARELPVVLSHPHVMWYDLSFVCDGSAQLLRSRQYSPEFFRHFPSQCKRRRDRPVACVRASTTARHLCPGDRDFLPAVPGAHTRYPSYFPVQAVCIPQKRISFRCGPLNISRTVPFRAAMKWKSVSGLLAVLPRPRSKHI